MSSLPAAEGSFRRNGAMPFEEPQIGCSVVGDSVEAGEATSDFVGVSGVEIAGLGVLTMFKTSM